jgi:hypothetical protein
LFRHLTGQVGGHPQAPGALEEIIGLREVSGLLDVGGRALRHEIDRAYRAARSTSKLTREQIAEVLVDVATGAAPCGVAIALRVHHGAPADCREPFRGS